MTEQRANDAEIIADFRRTYEQLLKTPVEHDHTTWSMRLTLEEMRALLAAVDERDELRRQGVGDFETGFTPVTVEKVIVEADPSRFMDALHFYQTKAATVTALPPIIRSDGVEAILHGEGCPRQHTLHDCPLGGCPTFESNHETTIPDLPPDHFDRQRNWCRWCSGAIWRAVNGTGAGAWQHNNPASGLHPAEPPA